MPKFRKKPVVIEAVQWTGGDVQPIVEFTGQPVSFSGDTPRIQTSEGAMGVSPGDWVIRGVKGELYPCKPDIFALTYDPSGDEPYETPEAKLVDLGNLLDEANGILIESGSELTKLGQEAEMLASTVEDLQARYHAVSEKIEHAEQIMAKVQLAQEAKNA